MKIYRVCTNMDLNIQEVDIIRKTDSSYWRNEKTREALDTTYVKSFDTKIEAIKFLENNLYSKQRNLEYAIERHNEQIKKFETMYNEFLV